MDEFTFSKENLDLIDIFSKNITLIWEHKRLSRAVEDLEIYDPLTGLYNRKYLRNRLNEEIKRSVAYQRPCGLLLVKVINFREFQDTAGIIEAEKFLKNTAKVFKDSLRPIDIPGRIEENKLAAILIERSRRQCQKMGENVRDTFNNYFKERTGEMKFLFSVAENPVDGNTAEELFTYASSSLQEL